MDFSNLRSLKLVSIYYTLLSFLTNRHSRKVNTSSILVIGGNNFGKRKSSRFIIFCEIWMTLRPDIPFYELPSVGLQGLQGHYVVQHKIFEPHDPVMVDDIQNNNFRTQTTPQLTRHFDKVFTYIVCIIGTLGNGDKCKGFSRQELACMAVASVISCLQQIFGGVLS